MTDLRRARCRNCGAHRSEVGAISWRGLCATCFPLLIEQNVHGLRNKSGVPWQRWRFGTARALLGDEVANVLYNAGAFGVDDGEPKA